MLSKQYSTPAGVSRVWTNPMVQEWWHRQSPTMRWVVAATGGVVVISGVVLAVHRIFRLKPFTSIGPQCMDFDLAKQAVLNEAIQPLVRAAAARGTKVDPFDVTKEFVRKYASDCATWPDARSPGEAGLFMRSFLEVLRVMQEEKLLNETEKDTFGAMIFFWGESKGVQSLAPLFPPLQGATAAES